MGRNCGSQTGGLDYVVAMFGDETSDADGLTLPWQVPVRVVRCGMTTSGPLTNATVVPLDGRLAEQDPWQLLAGGDGMLVSWSDGAAPSGRPWGVPLRATSTMAQQIRDIAHRAGGSGKVFVAGRTYRLEIPTGFGVEDLMGAVGGGLRATVRSHGSGRIAGQAKLIPLAVRGGALAPFVPALALMALITAAEMAGGDAQEAKLTAILEGVERIDAHVAMETDARLQTAEQTIRQAHAALLDGAVIPESIGLGTAMSNLQVVRNMSTTLIAGWERTVGGLPPGPTTGSGVRTTLGKVGRVGWDGFAASVRTAYLAITLDSRRIMLSAAEAQLRNPGLPLTAFRQAVEADLAARTVELDRLRRLLVRLSTVPLTLSSWSADVLPHRVADAAAENARTQALFATLASAFNAAQRATALPVVDNRIVIEAQLQPGGEVQLHRHDPGDDLA